MPKPNPVPVQNYKTMLFLVQKDTLKVSILVVLIFPTKRVFNIDYKVRPFYLQDDQCDQIGQFIGLWAIFKAFGNN